MCRSIKVLRRPGQVTTPEELSSAALQYVRKISGFQKPSRANQVSFDRAVQEITEASQRLLLSLGVPCQTTAESASPLLDGDKIAGTAWSKLES